MLDVTAFTGLGAGIHDVVVTGLDRKTSTKGTGDYLRWEFSDREGQTASANSSVEMTPGNKTGKWFAAVTGKPTIVGQQRAMAEAIGQPATIVIEINPEGYPKVVALTARQATRVNRPSPVQNVVQDPVAPLTAEEQKADELPF